MKRVIDGLTFDTETAEQVGYFNTGDTHNFNYRSETLYKTTSGQYFLHGEGGPRTQWRSRGDASRTCGFGQGIIPMGPVDAMRWCQENLEGEEEAWSKQLRI